MPYLHGCRDRLRSARVWSHGHLHQVRQEDERVPHLQAVCGAGGARLQVLTTSITSTERPAHEMVPAGLSRPGP